MVQSGMQEMRRRVSALNAGTTIRLHRTVHACADGCRSAFERPEVLDVAVRFLGVGDFEEEILASDDADVADLAARFAVKGRAVEDDCRRSRRGILERPV